MPVARPLLCWPRYIWPLGLLMYAGAQTQVFQSYSGLDSMEAPVERPDSIAALVGSMRAIAQNKQSLAFHAAGGSFHGQALACGPVLLLDRMPRDLAVCGATLEAASGATYGEANRAALAHRCVVPISPASHRITLGGGLVSNSVARFSPLVGKAADSVESFELITPDGRRRLVTRPNPDTSEQNDALFRAIPGGFGYLGYVSRIRSRLLALPREIVGTVPRVETTATPTTEFGPLIDGLVRAHLEANPSRQRGTVPNFGRHVADGAGTWALTNQDGLGMVFRSRYVPGDRPLSRFFLHQPKGVVHQLGQFASIFRIWSRLGWKAMWHLMCRQPLTFVDSFSGFTFMMDGNWQARETLRTLGISAWLLQQSYLLPIRRDMADPGAAAKAFLEASRRALHDAGVRIDCIELLTLPADDYLLSAARNREGVLISIACQGFSRSMAARFSAVLRDLSRTCADHGGRVHLVKNVFIEPDVASHMYGGAFRRFLELKSELDPAGILRNPFFDRLVGV